MIDGDDDDDDDDDDANAPKEGCRVCYRDDDHINLMLCEICNDEYHIYCLNPPLHAVPVDDWFCGTCEATAAAAAASFLLLSFSRTNPTLLRANISFLLAKCTGKSKKGKKDDGLNSLVVALPRDYTARFGEVCWAYGGIGFGWWPSCIFDPRLTEGSARQTAKKNLGKKHLVYFFECQEAPFAVMSNSKLMGWTEGLADNYHLGRTARAAGKVRSRQFQLALQAAIIEEDKPLDIRLDWNRNEEQAQLLPIPKRKKKRKAPAGKETDPVNVTGIKNDVDKTIKKKMRKSGPLFCRIVKRTLSDNKNEVDNSTNEVNIGFLKLPSMKYSTFADARKAIMKDIVPEALAPTSQWKFHVTTLGPVSSQQETSLGPIIPFLRSGIGGNVDNGGSIDDPITVVIFEPQD